MGGEKKCGDLLLGVHWERGDKMNSMVEAGHPPTSFDLKFHKLVGRATGNPILEMI